MEIYFRHFALVKPFVFRHTVVSKLHCNFKAVKMFMALARHAKQVLKVH